jgi:hypothetical protein
MRIIHILGVLLLAAVLSARSALAAESVALHAVLITASNDKTGSDPKLAAYEAELQRNLVFSAFRYAGEGSAQLAGGKSTTLSLPRGHRLEIEGTKSGGTSRLSIKWTHGSTVLMNTTLQVTASAPAVLVRRGGNDSEVPVVLLFAK